MWSKNQKPATAAERLHLARVKAMPCICCKLLLRTQETPTDVHHVRANGEPRSHWLTIPLCFDCHQGHNGVEMTRAYLAVLKVTEWGLLAVVLCELFTITHRR